MCISLFFWEGGPPISSLQQVRVFVLKNLFIYIYFWLCWVFVAVKTVGYCLVALMQASHCNGFSCCRAQALGHRGFSHCVMWPQQLWLLDSRAQTQYGLLLWHMGLAALQYV